jgi:hypothetical protein
MEYPKIESSAQKVLLVLDWPKYKQEGICRLETVLKVSLIDVFLDHSMDLVFVYFGHAQDVS